MLKVLIFGSLVILTMATLKLMPQSAMYRVVRVCWRLLFELVRRIDDHCFGSSTSTSANQKAPDRDLTLQRSAVFETRSEVRAIQAELQRATMRNETRDDEVVGTLKTILELRQDDLTKIVFNQKEVMQNFQQVREVSTQQHNSLDLLAAKVDRVYDILKSGRVEGSLRALQGLKTHHRELHNESQQSANLLQKIRSCDERSQKMLNTVVELTNELRSSVSKSSQSSANIPDAGQSAQLPKATVRPSSNRFTDLQQQSRSQTQTLARQPRGTSASQATGGNSRNPQIVGRGSQPEVSSRVGIVADYTTSAVSVEKMHNLPLEESNHALRTINEVAAVPVRERRPAREVERASKRTSSVTKATSRLQAGEHEMPAKVNDRRESSSTGHVEATAKAVHQDQTSKPDNKEQQQDQGIGRDQASVLVNQEQIAPESINQSQTSGSAEKGQKSPENIDRGQALVLTTQPQTQKPANQEQRPRDSINQGSLKGSDNQFQNPEPAIQEQTREHISEQLVLPTANLHNALESTGQEDASDNSAQGQAHQATGLAERLNTSDQGQAPEVITPEVMPEDGSQDAEAELGNWSEVRLYRRINNDLVIATELAQAVHLPGGQAETIFQQQFPHGYSIHNDARSLPPAYTALDIGVKAQHCDIYEQLLSSTVEGAVQRLRPHFEALALPEMELVDALQLGSFLYARGLDMDVRQNMALGVLEYSAEGVYTTTHLIAFETEPIESLRVVWVAAAQKGATHNWEFKAALPLDEPEVPPMKAVEDSSYVVADAMDTTEDSPTAPHHTNEPQPSSTGAQLEAPQSSGSAFDAPQEAVTETISREDIDAMLLGEESSSLSSVRELPSLPVSPQSPLSEVDESLLSPASYTREAPPSPDSMRSLFSDTGESPVSPRESPLSPVSPRSSVSSAHQSPASHVRESPLSPISPRSSVSYTGEVPLSPVSYTRESPPSPASPGSLVSHTCDAPSPASLRSLFSDPDDLPQSPPSHARESPLSPVSPRSSVPDMDEAPLTPVSNPRESPLSPISPASPSILEQAGEDFIRSSQQPVTQDEWTVNPLDAQDEWIEGGESGRSPDVQDEQMEEADPGVVPDVQEEQMDGVEQVNERQLVYDSAGLAPAGNGKAGVARGDFQNNPFHTQPTQFMPMGHIEAAEWSEDTFDVDPAASNQYAMPSDFDDGGFVTQAGFFDQAWADNAGGGVQGEIFTAEIQQSDFFQSGGFETDETGAFETENNTAAPQSAGLPSFETNAEAFDYGVGYAASDDYLQGFNVPSSSADLFDHERAFQTFGENMTFTDMLAADTPLPQFNEPETTGRQFVFPEQSVTRNEEENENVDDGKTGNGEESVSSIPQQQRGFSSEESTGDDLVANDMDQDEDKGRAAEDEQDEQDEESEEDEEDDEDGQDDLVKNDKDHKDDDSSGSGAGGSGDAGSGAGEADDTGRFNDNSEGGGNDFNPGDFVHESDEDSNGDIRVASASGDESVAERPAFGSEPGVAARNPFTPTSNVSRNALAVIVNPFVAPPPGLSSQDSMIDQSQPSPYGEKDGPSHTYTSSNAKPLYVPSVPGSRPEPEKAAQPSSQADGGPSIPRLDQDQIPAASDKLLSRSGNDYSSESKASPAINPPSPPRSIARLRTRRKRTKADAIRIEQEKLNIAAKIAWFNKRKSNLEHGVKLGPKKRGGLGATKFVRNQIRICQSRVEWWTQQYSIKDDLSGQDYVLYKDEFERLQAEPSATEGLNDELTEWTSRMTDPQENI